MRKVSEVTNSGGGIASLNGSVDIRHSQIVNNNSAGIGGGINILAGKLAIRHSDITDNTAGGGGGISANSSKINIGTSNILRNRSTLAEGDLTMKQVVRQQFVPVQSKIMRQF